MGTVVPPISSAAQAPVEYFDVLNEIGATTGIVKLRSHVHRDGEHNQRPLSRNETSTRNSMSTTATAL